MSSLLLHCVDPFVPGALEPPVVAVSVGSSERHKARSGEVPALPCLNIEVPKTPGRGRTRGTRFSHARNQVCCRIAPEEHSPRTALLLGGLDDAFSLVRRECRAVVLEAVQDIEPESQALILLAARPLDFGTDAGSLLAVESTQRPGIKKM